MKKGKIYISSTCFDLKDLRAELANEIASWGYQSMWNESPNFPVRQGMHSHDACLDAVKKSDIFVLIIDGRYGGVYSGDKYPKKDISITQYETEIALSENKQILTFVRDDIWSERAIYKKNLEDGIKIQLFYAKDERVYEFIEFINKQKQASNWINQFKNSVELKDILKAKLKIDTQNNSLKLVTNEIKNPRPSNKNVLLYTGNNEYIILDGKSINLGKTKTYKIDLDSDGIEEVFLIGRDHPNGIKICGSTDQTGQNLYYDIDFENAFDYSSIKDNYYIQISFFDFDYDSIKEVAVSIGNFSDEMKTFIFKFTKNTDKPFEYIGSIDGQKKMVVDKNHSIFVLYGSFGVCNEFKYTNNHLYEVHLNGELKLIP
jgi:hypothetical protein